MSNENQSIEYSIGRDNDNIPELTGNSKIIYEEVKNLVIQLIGNRKFTTEMIVPTLNKLIIVIEKISKDQEHPLTNEEKKQLCLTVLDHIIKDLSALGKIDPQVASVLLLSINCLGSIIIDYAVDVVKKVKNVIVDVNTNGCKGCCARNFFKKK